MPRASRSSRDLPPPSERRRFRRRLLGWYQRHGRKLPWRKTRDPYRILVSEVMLQQTQVDRVLPKYKEWLKRFPTFNALAASRLSEARRAWYPLGYNIRPKRLHAIAREVVANYGGRLPADEERLQAFKGLGPYTVGAVRSFAFGECAAIVDTNVSRVLLRVFAGHTRPRNHAMKRHVWELSRTLLPRQRAYDFNQALMDFGALVCTARNPVCVTCPMKKDCVAYGSTKGSGVTTAS